MQHPRNRKTVAGPLALAAFCLLWMGLGTGRALAQAQDPAGPNVARVSFVQGSVQLLAGQGSDFQQAVMNMPVVDGSRLQAGGDGQAEVEFGDGSVARLTPNSTLQFDHLGQDRVQLQQLSGLAYYEFNVGDGHPPFSVQFNNLYVQPTANAILRVGLDAGWEVAVISGSVNVQGDGIPGVTVAENQSIRSGAENSGAPYTVAQGINGDSWDNWNQDRDQAIAQEASQQTPVRDDSANPQNENWNDLDADGNWYPVEGTGNVWVPAGVGPGWDPYGSGYWAYYPTIGYTWVSGYPWGWLPYHCGRWGYYSFGWGWAPGGCGRVWSPVIVVRNYPAGWVMPVRPVFRGGAYPLPPTTPGCGRSWTGGHRPLGTAWSSAQAKSSGGPELEWAHDYPSGSSRRSSAGIPCRPRARRRGRAPCCRALLSGRRSGRNSAFWGANPPRAIERPNEPVAAKADQRAVGLHKADDPRRRPIGRVVGYSGRRSSRITQRSTYVARPTPTTALFGCRLQPHYSASTAVRIRRLPGAHR